MKKLSDIQMEQTKGGFVWGAFWLGFALVVVGQTIIDLITGGR